MIYFISDTHFNHENVIKYCNRPFANKEEMNEALISNWNSIVTNKDIVYHLGDVALTNESEMKDIISKLNGKKYLIRGNHDKKSVLFYENAGFIVLKDAPIKIDKYNLILSHYPIPDTMIPKGYINIHGHIHNNKLNEDLDRSGTLEYPKEKYDPKKHINISCDVIDFTPVSIDYILEAKADKEIPSETKKKNWEIAIGMQEASGSNVSKKFRELVKQHINGEITKKELDKLLYEYHNIKLCRKTRNKNKRKEFHKFIQNIKNKNQKNAKSLDLKEAEKKGEFIPYPITEENIQKKNINFK